MRFDYPGGHQQVGFEGHPVEYHGDTVPGQAEIDQPLRIDGLVVDDPVSSDDPLPQLLDLLPLAARPVHAQATEQRDVLVAHTGRFQLVQKRRHQVVVWAGAGDVGEDDADSVARFRELPQLR